jgi:glycerophosphoryl diester phosphodiesterase
LPPVEQLIRKAKAAGLDGLDVGRAPAIDRDFVRRVKQAGLELFVWTVNSPEEARGLQAAGVDGVTTDRPGWLKERLTATRN